MIYIGCDPAGRELAEVVYQELVDSSQECSTIAEANDYPVIAESIAQEVRFTEDKAILICGTGIGMSITANKIIGIRAAVCTNEYMSEMARRHNDANILCLGARVIGKELAKRIVRAFLTVEFEGGRHERRLKLIKQ